MRQSIKIKRKLYRKAYLEAERGRYLAMPGKPFRIVNECEHDLSVIWQGIIRDPSLKNDYEIQIHYGAKYPFCRPKVFPVDKSIRDNRHQNPTPFADLHWLVYEFNFQVPSLKKGVIPGFRKKTQHKEILRRNSNKELKIYPTHHLSKESLFRRISAPSFQAMDKKTVLLIGCGTVGSRVAELLIKAGLGHILLVDNDELKVGNVCRHVLGLDNLGSNKAVALKEHLLQRNPFAEIEVSNKNILTADTWLSTSIKRADLVISCIGSDAAETWVNECTMSFSKPTFFCRTYAHATIGEILFARSGRCCFRCASEYFKHSDCKIPRPPDLKFEEMVDFDADCGATFIPASAVDVDLVSLHCARLAISFLTGEELQADYWITRGRAFGKDEDWDLDEEVLPSFKVLDYLLEDCGHCKVCGNSGGRFEVTKKKCLEAEMHYSN